MKVTTGTNRVHKFGTGHNIPKGAVYLCTKVQRKARLPIGPGTEWIDCWLVWHYFLVDVVIPTQEELEDETII